MGGSIKNPCLYREICTGRTGHAEGIRLVYDESIVSYKDLLYVFFVTHDPTTLNRQGNDVGTQYRSAIFYVDKHRKILQKKCIAALQASTFRRAYRDRVVTRASFLYRRRRAPKLL